MKPCSTPGDFFKLHFRCVVAENFYFGFAKGFDGL